MVFKLLCVGHVLGDFYFQSDKMAKEKGKKWRIVILHCFIYFIVLLGILILFCENGTWWAKLSVAGIASIIHGGIDKGKTVANNRKWFQKEAILFLIDQGLHIGLLYILSLLISAGISEKGDMISGMLMPFLSFLVCWKPASIFIAMVFHSIPGTGRNQQKNVGTGIGSWIGILEREIILVLGNMGQFAAIGFVLTAKSFARHKQLENQDFAEKYIVGTLLSSLIAFVCVWLCQI